MPIDPYAAVHAMVRAEAARTDPAPPHRGATPTGSGSATGDSAPAPTAGDRDERKARRAR
jgi:hypothetical protein